MKNYISISRLILLLLFFTAKSISLTSQENQSYRINTVGEEAYKAILQFYQYDKDIPLELRKVERIETDEYIREKVVFIGVNNSKVVGYLATPKAGKPPYPCVLQMHGLTVSKSDFWQEEYHLGELVTKGLLSAGYAVLALDMPYHGERSFENNFESTYVTLFTKGWGYRIRDMVVQSTIEYRRAIDYLETRPDIDANKIGAIGYSLGSVITFILTGIDERIKTSVVCATAVIKPRPFFPPEEYLSGFAPQTFLRSFKDRPILILAANKDDFNCTVQEANQLYNLIDGDNKKLIFYNSGHKLPPEHCPVAVDWFKEHLK